MQQVEGTRSQERHPPQKKGGGGRRGQEGGGGTRGRDVAEVCSRGVGMKFRGSALRGPPLCLREREGCLLGHFGFWRGAKVTDGAV